MAKDKPPDKMLFDKVRYILVTTCFVGYCLYYLTRKSCTYSLPMLLEDTALDLTKETAGVMFSVQMLSYSVGKFTCGILSDRYSCRIMFSVGLFLSGVTNILFACCQRNYQFTLIWAANGVFQGCGWAPIAILVKRWFLPGEIGRVWSFMSVTMNLSGSMIPLLMVSLSSIFNWRFTFTLLGGVSCLFSFLAFNFIQDNPNHISSGNVNSNNAPDTAMTSNEDNAMCTSDETEDSSSDFFSILSSKFLVFISISYLLWTALKNGVEDWLLIYLTTEKSFSSYQASLSMMWFQFGGLTSCLGCGFVTDILMAKYQSRMRSSPRLPVALFCSLFIICWFYLLQTHFVSSNILFVNVICFMTGLCCYGPHTLYGLLVLENAPPGLGGTAHGIAGTASTVGSIFSGYPFSYVIEKYSWNVVFDVLRVGAVVNSCLLLLCMTVTCKIEKRKKKME